MAIENKEILKRKASSQLTPESETAESDITGQLTRMNCEIKELQKKQASEWVELQKKLLSEHKALIEVHNQETLQASQTDLTGLIEKQESQLMELEINQKKERGRLKERHEKEQVDLRKLFTAPMQLSIPEEKKFESPSQIILAPTQPFLELKKKLDQRYPLETLDHKNLTQPIFDYYKKLIIEKYHDFFLENRRLLFSNPTSREVVSELILIFEKNVVPSLTILFDLFMDKPSLIAQKLPPGIKESKEFHAFQKLAAILFYKASHVTNNKIEDLKLLIFQIWLAIEDTENFIDLWGLTVIDQQKQMRDVNLIKVLSILDISGDIDAQMNFLGKSLEGYHALFSSNITHFKPVLEPMEYHKIELSLEVVKDMFNNNYKNLLLREKQTIAHRIAKTFLDASEKKANKNLLDSFFYNKELLDKFLFQIREQLDLPYLTKESLVKQMKILLNNTRSLSFAEEDFPDVYKDVMSYVERELWKNSVNKDFKSGKKIEQHFQVHRELSSTMHRPPHEQPNTVSRWQGGRGKFILPTTQHEQMMAEFFAKISSPRQTIPSTFLPTTRPPEGPPEGTWESSSSLRGEEGRSDDDDSGDEDSAGKKPKNS